MNFGFKSTFIRSIRRLALISKLPHSAWLLLLNVTIASTALHLYLNNYIIPAVIGSWRYGSYYISILEAGLFFLAATSAYAILSLLIMARINHRDYQGPDIFVLKLFHYIRQSSLIIIMLIHISRFMPGRGFTPMRLLTRGFHLCHPPQENNHYQL